MKALMKCPFYGSLRFQAAPPPPQPSLAVIIGGREETDCPPVVLPAARVPAATSNLRRAHVYCSTFFACNESIEAAAAAAPIVGGDSDRTHACLPACFACWSVTLGCGLKCLPTPE